MSCNKFVCPFHEQQASDYLSSESDMKCLITDTLKQVRLEKGDILFVQGQRSDCVFSLSSGIVKLTHHTEDGREQIVGLSTPGNLLAGLQSINAQLAHSRSLMKVMGHKRASARIASFIKLIIPSSEHANKRFTLPFSRREIANLLGLSEETVCRQMASMNRRGILYAPRGRIEVLDWDQLQTVADEPRAAD